MSLSSYDLSAGVFIRGLTNLKQQLTKAEEHLAADGGSEAASLNARLVADGVPGVSYAPTDLHAYTLAAQAHWAAEGSRLAIGQLLGVHVTPNASVATSFADLHEHLDATIAYLREVDAGDLEAGLDREIVIEHRRGSARSSGSRFLVAFAIPHFFYHVTAAYSILRNHGVPLTMGDFLGTWNAS